MIRHRLAAALRSIATRLDGEAFISDDLHKAAIRSMNRYIGQTESYIIALEERIEIQSVVKELREQYQRIDTKKLRDAGAWSRWS